MVKRNQHIAKLQPSYLFVQINEKKKAHLVKKPLAKLISLGIGDTTQPLFKELTESITSYATSLGTKEGYSGYSEWNGPEDLRKSIAKQFYDDKVSPDEIVLSDGSKPDLARIQLLFDHRVSIAVQDPVYPAYVDQAVIAGKTGTFDTEKQQYGNVVYLPCTPENNFFPDLNVPRTDLIFFCSPNNPTGACATRDQLTKLVNHALENNSIIIFDSAYREFIVDPSIPKTIYEIPGAEKCALETSSFSKLVGFTGVRLGWTVCPKKVLYEDGQPVYDDWKRVMGTTFNGASNVALEGGRATLANLDGMRKYIAYYMENAKVLRAVLEKKGLPIYGGDNSPYLWVKIVGKSSWDLFNSLLEQVDIVCTPGSGFGSCGEGFVRFSCFASHESVAEAAKRLETWNP
uniref:LL-diaminopimelate aminotransferase DapL n=1 Tax=Hematodinium sp. SG-2015 TaxID=1649283 RepID=A0A0F7EWT7_9DINO|nr:LL-diaminopimelate aminotransferase DapL [Hematodinium sp. SG-2015]|eukprot:GEMP01041973.1.p1 GENE.GEMP01041973.1~~GEMP01041973.1.p1  ORF type:complete len:402 (+),score=74.60 GEMP01041973.1:52-1257(+)